MRLSITAAASRAGAPALILAGKAVSFAELAASVSALAGGGGLCTVVGHRRLETVVQILAALEHRRPLLLLHPRSTAAEREAIVARVQASLPATSPAPAVILPTSGTSGAPKLVRLSEAALIAAADASAKNLPWRQADRWLLNLPLAHVGGLSVLTRCLLAGSTVVVADGARFEPETLLAQIERDRVTLMSLVPTMLAKLLETSTGDAPSALRAVLIGGAASSEPLLAAARRRRWPVLRTYGLSEACAQVATQGLANRSAGCGGPLPGVRLRVVDDKIQVAGPTLFDGYLGEPSPLVDGWFTTGDRGFCDAQGDLHVLGRTDDVIICGGENVDPVEVELALEALSPISEAAVVGAPDPTWGAAVVAVVVADADIDLESVQSRLRGRLASFKHPRRLVRVEALPKTPSGKLDRGALAGLVPV